eukprot:m51a1_g5521 putative microsomal signal peptidase subunit (179) ;mRNA; r:419259-420158
MATTQPKEEVRVSPYNGHQAKQAIEDHVVSYMTGKLNFTEYNFWNDWRIFWGGLSCIVMILSHFYPMPWPQNKPLLVACVAIYAVASVVLHFTMTRYVKDSFLWTKGVKGAPALVLSSRMDKYGDMMTLVAELQSDDRVRSVLTMSITEWFDGNGVLHQPALNQAVDRLLANLRKKNK